MTLAKQYRSTYCYSGFEDNENTTCLNHWKREHFVIANKVLVSSIWMVLTLTLEEFFVKEVCPIITKCTLIFPVDRLNTT